MIKRFLSMVLCLCLLSTASVALAADEVKHPDGSTTFNEAVGVNITAIATDTTKTNADDVYSVEIVWGDMAFAWGRGAEEYPAKWNPETHQYETEDGEAINEIDPEWYMVTTTDLSVAYSDELEDDDTFVLKTQDAVMVFNHSNQPVKATIAIDNTDTADTIADAGITASLGTANNESAEKELAVTENDVYAEASSVVYKVVLSTPGDESKIPTGNAAVVAELNVTISKVETTPEVGD